jgi:hypothetical protein
MLFALRNRAGLSPFRAGDDEINFAAPTFRTPQPCRPIGNRRVGLDSVTAHSAHDDEADVSLLRFECTGHMAQTRASTKTQESSDSATMSGIASSRGRRSALVPSPALGGRFQITVSASSCHTPNGVPVPWRTAREDLRAAYLSSTGQVKEADPREGWRATKLSPSVLPNQICRRVACRLNYDMQAGCQSS